MANVTGVATGMVGLSTGAMSTGTVSPGAVSTGTVSAGVVSTGSVSTGAVSTGAVSTGTVSTGAASTGAVSTGAVSTGAASTGATSTDVVSTGAVSTGAASTGAVSTGMVSNGTGHLANTSIENPVTDSSSDSSKLRESGNTILGNNSEKSGPTDHQKGSSTPEVNLPLGREVNLQLNPSFGATMNAYPAGVNVKVDPDTKMLEHVIVPSAVNSNQVQRIGNFRSVSSSGPVTLLKQNVSLISGATVSHAGVPPARYLSVAGPGSHQNFYLSPHTASQPSWPNSTNLTSVNGGAATTSFQQPSGQTSVLSNHVTKTSNQVSLVETNFISLTVPSPAVNSLLAPPTIPPPWERAGGLLNVASKSATQALEDAAARTKIEDLPANRENLNLIQEELKRTLYYHQHLMATKSATPAAKKTMKEVKERIQNLQKIQVAVVNTLRQEMVADPQFTSSGALRNQPDYHKNAIIASSEGTSWTSGGSRSSKVKIGGSKMGIAPPDGGTALLSKGRGQGTCLLSKKLPMTSLSRQTAVGEDSASGEFNPDANQSDDDAISTGLGREVEGASLRIQGGVITCTGNTADAKVSTCASAGHPVYVNKSSEERAVEDEKKKVVEDEESIKKEACKETAANAVITESNTNGSSLGGNSGREGASSSSDGGTCNIGVKVERMDVDEDATEYHAEEEAVVDSSVKENVETRGGYEENYSSPKRRKAYTDSNCVDAAKAESPTARSPPTISAIVDTEPLYVAKANYALQNMNSENDRAKLLFMAALDLVTPDTVTHLEQKLSEKHRLAKANPRFISYRKGLRRAATSGGISSRPDTPTSVATKRLATSYLSSPSASELSSKRSRCRSTKPGLFAPTQQQNIGVVAGIPVAFSGSTTKQPVMKVIEVHDDFCAVCCRSGELLLCDTCSLVYHLACLTPALPSVPDGLWSCPKCVSLVSGPSSGHGKDGKRNVGGKNEKGPRKRDRQRKGKGVDTAIGNTSIDNQNVNAGSKSAQALAAGGMPASAVLSAMGDVAGSVQSFMERKARGEEERAALVKDRGELGAERRRLEAHTGELSGELKAGLVSHQRETDRREDAVGKVKKLRLVVDALRK